MSDETYDAMAAAILAHYADEYGIAILDDWIVSAVGQRLEDPPFTGMTCWKPSPAYRLYGLLKVAEMDVNSRMQDD